MAAVVDQPQPRPERRRPDPRQGVFETLLVLDGRPVELDAHLARLRRSLEELYPDREAPELEDEVRGRASEAERGAVRASVAPAGGGGLRAEVDLRSATGDFLPLSGKNSPPASVAVHRLPLPGGLGPHKWVDRSLLDEAQSRLPGDALPLLLDGDAALEASRANLFAVRDGALLTPPLDGRILPGVTRRRVLELADELGIEAGEAALSRADLLAAEEVFLTGSVRGVERVGLLDGAPLSAGGEVAARIAAELRLTWSGARTAT
jgi:para-aminobenzoate synthetase / 4-amino-4-deoxychorismate lyase